MLVVVGCSQENVDPFSEDITTSDILQTYAGIKGFDPDAAPGAPAACPVDGNKDKLSSTHSDSSCRMKGFMPSLTLLLQTMKTKIIAWLSPNTRKRTRT